MRYFIIAGEASGDLHASHLARAIAQHDPHAELMGIGGELMRQAGVRLLRHYSTLAYMGFLQVALHLPQILSGMRACKAALREWRPDCLICVDYPGFNLSIARWVKRQSLCPTFYYIAPKIWAWREGRIRNLRRDVDELFSILPFEPDYFERRHGYPVVYVGNPTLDEVETFLDTAAPTSADFCRRARLDPSRPLIALLPGSRRSEIDANLPHMLRATRLADPEGTFQTVVLRAPSLDPEAYRPHLEHHPARLLDAADHANFALLRAAHAALVTSGTATLETALLGAPQVVCYRLRGGRLVPLLRRLLLRCRFISLVNLIAGYEVVPELVGPDANAATIAAHLRPLLTGTAPRTESSPERDDQLRGYALLRHRLGERGAPLRAARAIVGRLRPSPPPPPTPPATETSQPETESSQPRTESSQRGAEKPRPH